MRKVWIYRLLAILLPFLLLAGIEGVLRFANYGYDTHLFITDPDNPNYLVMNRDISKKYFSLSQNATIGNQEPFRKEKPSNTIRFFVLGASSSLGFPYMHNGSFSRMLKYKLQFEYPQYRIELINLSLTAINSYTLYDFAKQVVDYEPDGIILYAGHNEYYGALGAASSSRTGTHPQMTEWLINAKKLKIMQAVSSVSSSWEVRDSSLINPDRTLMERMAAHQMVPLHSELYEQGIKQFDGNLKKILQLFQKRQIPVFIGTLASNLKDQAPLEKENKTAGDIYKNAIQAYEQEDFEAALQGFKKAKETDGLRFRAPDAFNELIRKYATTMDNVHLVDVSEKLSEHSPHQLIGKELLLEHVHPNLNGHRRIAEAYYEVLQKNFFQHKSKEGGCQIDLQEYPTTAFDTIYGDLVIRQLKQQWPFNEEAEPLHCDTSRFEFKIALKFFYRKLNWGEAMQKLNNYYILQKDYASALRIVEQMCLELPYEKIFLKQAGMLNQRLQHKEKADYYLKQLNYD